MGQPTLLWFTITILFGWITGAQCACLEFEEIDEKLYDRNYTSITNDARPLGYLKSVVPFNAPSDDLPCFLLNGVSGRHVEIMFETIPSSKLCIRDQANNQQCEEGRFASCTPASGDTMTLTFYHDVAQGSTESDITFWVRLTKGPSSQEDNEGMWCQWRDSDYPEGLQPLPPGFVPPIETPPAITDTAATRGQSPTLLALTQLVFIKYLLYAVSA